MDEKVTNKPSLSNSLGTSAAMLGISAGLTGMLGNLMFGGNTMFGNTNDVPKGTVKEMMHGLMLGVVDLINEKEYETKELREKVEEQKEKISQLTEDKNAAETRYEEVMGFLQDAKRREAEAKKKSYTGKKRGPKSKKKEGRPKSKK